METRLELDILPQPDDTTCGPTCLHAVYRYFNKPMPLDQVIREVPCLEGGGTLAVLLGAHALARGFEGVLYTYNLQVFDPTWFGPDAPDLTERLTSQMAVKDSPRLQTATKGYLEFIRLGGSVRMEDLTTELVRGYLKRGIPILTGLSATFLYRDMREHGPSFESDDLRGRPAGHFVVLCGYDRESRSVLTADPLMPNPLTGRHLYELNIDRVVNAVLLGIVTYDADLLVLQPAARKQRRPRADRHRGR